MNQIHQSLARASRALVHRQVGHPNSQCSGSTRRGRLGTTLHHRRGRQSRHNATTVHHKSNGTTMHNVINNNQQHPPFGNGNGGDVTASVKAVAPGVHHVQEGTSTPAKAGQPGINQRNGTQRAQSTQSPTNGVNNVPPRESNSTT